MERQRSKCDDEGFLQPEGAGGQRSRLRESAVQQGASPSLLPKPTRANTSVTAPGQASANCAGPAAESTFQR
jgi:hypothetical protein